MKQCSQCGKTYSDDTSFCLEDGTALAFSGFSSEPEPQTIVTPKQPDYQPPPVSRTAIWVYPVIGIMALLVMVLGALAVLPYLIKLSSVAGTTNTGETNRKPIDFEIKGSPSPFVQTSPTVKESPKAPTASPTPDSPSSRGRFPEGSTRYLTAADLSGKSDWDLRIMRNEIFARHGYKFKKPELRQYFSSQSWYTPMYDDVSSFLSSVEKQNALFLKAHE